MKPPLLPRRFHSLSTFAALAMLGLPLHAATVTWDNSNGTNAWSTGANWDTNAEPVAADDVLLAAGLAATLTLSAGENAKTLTIDDNYTLTSGGLTLASAGSIGVAATRTATINTALTATGGVTKTGDGTLTLGASNAITGGFLVSAGTLRLAATNAVNSGNTITVNTGAVLEAANIASDRAVTWNNGATLAGSGTGASLTGVLTIEAVATAVTFATAAASDVLTIGNGANDLTGGTSATTINVTGPGSVRLAVASNYDGSWNVASGARLELAVAGALGDTAASGVTLSGGALSARVNSATTFTGQSNVTLTANSSLLSDRSSAGAGVTHTFGTLALGAHTLTVAPGTNATSATAGITVGNVTLSGNATFAVNDAGAANGKLNTGSLLGGGVARTLTKTGAGDIAITGGATDLVAGSSFTMTGGGSLDMLFPTLGAGASIAVTDAQHPLGAASFSQTGGALNLLADGDNTTSVQNFVLANGFTLGGDITLDPNRRTSGSSNTNKVFDVPTLTLAAGTVLTMVGDNTYGVRITGATTLQGNVTLQGTATTSRDGRLTLNGAIGDGGGGHALTIAGGGLASPLNLTLNAASTYSGGTTMSGSNVTLNSANALGTGPLAQSGGSLIVNVDGAIAGAITLSGGTLRVNDLDALAGNTIALNGGTLDLRTNTTATFTTGTLTLSGDATLNFANNTSGSSLVPTLGNAINVSGNRTLTITNGNNFAPNLASIALAGDLTLSSAISVSVQAISQDATPRRFIKAGTGTTTLTGTGTFTGGAEVLAGVLQINDTTALGGSVLTIGDTSGTATAQALLGVGPSLANDIVIRAGSSGTATLRTAASGLTWAGNVALQRTGTLETTTLATFSGVLSGVGNVSKTGGGEIILGNAANSFGSGAAASINITAGTLTVQTDGALGAAANGVTIGTGVTFRADGTFTSARTITPGGVAANIDVTTGNTLTLTSALGGNVAFDKEGLGTLAFGPAVTSARTAVTIVNDGTLRLSGATSLGAASPVTLQGGTLDLRNDTNTSYLHPLTIASGSGTVNVDRAVGGVATGGTHTLGTVAIPANLTLNTTGSNGFGLALGAVTSTTGTSSLNHNAPGALTVDSIGLGGTSGTFTFTMTGDGGPVSVSGALAETGTPIYNFVKTGAHTLTLGTSFVTRGTFTVTAGTLDLNDLNVVLNSTMTIGGAAGTAASVTTGTGSLMLGGTLTFSSSGSPPGASITGNLDLGAATRTFTINDSFNAAIDLEVAGPISGAVGSGFTKVGNGTLRLSGAGNTFSGPTTVQVGTVELGKSSGDAIGTGGLGISTTTSTAATVRLLAANQINDTAVVGITNTSGAAQLDLAGFSETLGATTLAAATSSGASLTTGAGGTLVLGGSLTLANNFSSSSSTTPRRVLITGTGTIGAPTTDGTLNLGGATRTIAVTTTVVGANAANANAVIETAIVNGGINKTGAQALYLTNPASTFAGGVNIAEGVVDVGAAGAAGSGAITFANTATSALRLSTGGLTLANPLVISAAGAAEAQLSYTGPIYTGATLSGAITLERDLTVDVLTGFIDQSDGQLFGRLTLSGNIDDGAGAFALTKKGNGVLRLTGTNTHGGMVMEKGTVEFSADSALGQAGVAATIAGGTLHAETSLATARPVVFTSAGNVRVDAPNVLELTGAITPGGFDMGFYGSGTTILSGTGGGGAGGLIVGKYASNFADPGTGTPQIDFGHVLSVRGTVALPAGNIWLLNDGVLELGTGDFTRAVGTGAGQVRMETYIGAGFAAHGANRVVNLGGAGATLTVGDPVTYFLRADTGFGFDGIGALVLGSTTATHTVTFQNPLEFNSGDATNGRTIKVPNGPAAKEAIMTGNLSLNGLPGTTDVYIELNVDGALDITGTISGAITLAMYGTGQLTLTGTNTFTGLTSIDGGGTVNVNADAAFGNAANAVYFYNTSTLQAAANITTNRAFEFSASEGAGMVIDTNGFSVTFGSGSSLTGDRLQKVGTGTLTIAGAQSYDTLTASAGTTIVDSALGSGSSTINAFAGAHVIIRTSQTLAELNIGPGSTVTFTSGVPAPFAHAVPEPGALALLLLGAVGISSRRRRGTAVGVIKCESAI